MVLEMEEVAVVTVTGLGMVEMAGLVEPLEAVVEGRDTATQVLVVLLAQAPEAK